MNGFELMIDEKKLNTESEIRLILILGIVIVPVLSIGFFWLGSDDRIWLKDNDTLRAFILLFLVLASSIALYFQLPNFWILSSVGCIGLFGFMDISWNLWPNTNSSIRITKFLVVVWVLLSYVLHFYMNRKRNTTVQDDIVKGAAQILNKLPIWTYRILSFMAGLLWLVNILCIFSILVGLRHSLLPPNTIYMALSFFLSILYLIFTGLALVARATLFYAVKIKQKNFLRYFFTFYSMLIGTLLI